MNRKRKHIRSWQFVPLGDDVPGAILVSDLIISFSGLSGYGNEVISLILSAEICVDRENAISKIIEISENPYFDDMYSWWEKSTRWE